MENILVAIDGKHEAWEAFSRACALSRRVQVQVNVLFVFAPRDRTMPHSETEMEQTVKQRLELLMEAAKSEGVRVNYFITEGVYYEEVIAFANTNKVTLLVYEITDGETRNPERESGTLRAIRHRIACRVESVSPKKAPCS